MVKLKRTIRQIGTSQGIIFDKTIMQLLNLEIGDNVEIPMEQIKKI